MADPPLRVLQVTATAVGGTWFHDQVTGLARRGHDVRAVLPEPGPLASRLVSAGIGVDIVRFRGKRPGQLPRIAAAELRLFRLIRDFRPDVIHAHLLKAILACRLASAGYRPALRVTQVPGTVHLHIPVLRWLDRWTLRRDDVVIGSCQAIADRYRAMGARSVAVSYYGCDVHAIDPSTPGAAFRREFGLADDTPAIGMIAHMYRSRLRAATSWPATAGTGANWRPGPPPAAPTSASPATGLTSPPCWPGWTSWSARRSRSQPVTPPWRRC